MSFYSRPITSGIEPTWVQRIPIADLFKAADINPRVETITKPAETETQDAVNHPSHYNHGTIECIDYLRDTLGEGFVYYLEGNIKKYLHRWRYKGGLEDLKKAMWYLDLLIKEEENAA